jgi:hypothetical protein
LRFVTPYRWQLTALRLDDQPLYDGPVDAAALQFLSIPAVAIFRLPLLFNVRFWQSKIKVAASIVLQKFSGTVLVLFI